MNTQEQLAIYRNWQKENPEWQLVCDLGEKTSRLYVQWAELPQKEKARWRRIYGIAGRDAYNEFAIKRCKVKHGVLCPDLKVRPIAEWPAGFCMGVYKTGGVL